MTRKKAKMTPKTVPLEIRFRGDGSLTGEPGQGWSGGIAAPAVGDQVRFYVWEERLDENGILNPSDEPYEGALQIDIRGEAEGYRELARYLLALAELDTGAHEDFHEHHEVISADGRTRLHLILRKGAARH
ncbi:MAG TPA: hypothetical protein PKW33_06665 [Anaerolineaceae bacterium]|nr:hypothetical protein [Anaerolineaceae bacterium]HPN51251.1 hypothetical protein [Anaerolineaceae bacterium]